MDEISKFFKDLYYQFLLRDFAAKVIPGLFIFIAFIAATGNGDVLYDAAYSLIGIIFLFSLGLMLGSLLRFIGNRTYVFSKRNIKLGPRTFTVRDRSFTLGPIKFSLPNINWTPIVLHAWGSEEESMKKELTFHHYTNLENNNYARIVRERLVIFKEMAGTYAAAFSLVFVFALYDWIKDLLDNFDNLTIERFLIIVVLWVVMMVLSRNNKALAETQRNWERLIIDAKGKLPATSAASATKRTTRKTKS